MAGGGGRTQYCSRRKSKPALLHRFEFTYTPPPPPPSITQWFIRSFIFCGCCKACLLKSLRNGPRPCPVTTLGSGMRNVLRSAPVLPNGASPLGRATLRESPPGSNSEGSVRLAPSAPCFSPFLAAALALSRLQQNRLGHRAASLRARRAL